MIKYYDIAESALSSKPFEAESVYYCTDSGAVYVDSLAEGTRKRMSKDVIILSSESDRTSILAPIPEKIYCVIETGSMYIFSSSWVRLGSRPYICFDNVIVENGTLTVEDERIKATDTAIFTPDLSVIDLASEVKATCSDGFVTVTLVSSYPIPGRVNVNN